MAAVEQKQLICWQLTQCHSQGGYQPGVSRSCSFRFVSARLSTVSSPPGGQFGHAEASRQRFRCTCNHLQEQFPFRCLYRIRRKFKIRKIYRERSVRKIYRIFRISKTYRTGRAYRWWWPELPLCHQSCPCHEKGTLFIIIIDYKNNETHGHWEKYIYLYYNNNEAHYQKPTKPLFEGASG